MVENAKYVKIILHQFCCHSLEEQHRIELALNTMGWEPVDVALQGMTCTTDEGAEAAVGYQGQLLGIHAGVTPASHQALTRLSRLIRHYAGTETGISEERKGAIEPRIAAFRMRLGSVGPAFDLRKVAEEIKKMPAGESFKSQWIQVGAITIQAYKPKKHKS